MNNIALGNPDTDTLRSEMECGVDEQFIKGYHGPNKRAIPNALFAKIERWNSSR